MMSSAPVQSLLSLFGLHNKEEDGSQNREDQLQYVDYFMNATFSILDQGDSGELVKKFAPSVNGEDFFKLLDTAGDGVVSREEFISGTKKHLNQAREILQMLGLHPKDVMPLKREEIRPCLEDAMGKKGAAPMDLDEAAEAVENGHTLYRAILSIHDKNGDSKVTFKEFTELMADRCWKLFKPHSNNSLMRMFVSFKRGCGLSSISKEQFEKGVLEHKQQFGNLMASVIFYALDRDNSGTITPEDEFFVRNEKVGKTVFEVFDTNKDGTITAIEFIHQFQKAKDNDIIDVLFDALDDNGDGKINWKELNKMSCPELLKKYDNDDKGVLSQEDFAEMLFEIVNPSAELKTKEKKTTTTKQQQPSEQAQAA